MVVHIYNKQLTYPMCLKFAWIMQAMCFEWFNRLVTDIAIETLTSREIYEIKLHGWHTKPPCDEKQHFLFSLPFPVVMEIHPTKHDTRTRDMVNHPSKSQSKLAKTAYCLRHLYFTWKLSPMPKVVTLLQLMQQGAKVTHRIYMYTEEAISVPFVQSSTLSSARWKIKAGTHITVVTQTRTWGE